MQKPEHSHRDEDPQWYRDLHCPGCVRKAAIEAALTVMDYVLMVEPGVVFVNISRTALVDAVRERVK